MHLPRYIRSRPEEWKEVRLVAKLRLKILSDCECPFHVGK
jgi:hypothetical protein